MYLKTVTSRVALHPSDFRHYHNEGGHPDDYMDRGVIYVRVVNVRRQAAVLQVALRTHHIGRTAMAPHLLTGVMMFID